MFALHFTPWRSDALDHLGEGADRTSPSLSQKEDLKSGEEQVYQEQLYDGVMVGSADSVARRQTVLK